MYIRHPRTRSAPGGMQHRGGEFSSSSIAKKQEGLAKQERHQESG
ncbi:hypothetical protein CSUI_011153 [Cystoisospora suis]|uniref:Uncharacterized protein n=1 Tax=Cystoisospora suis TaxID=483139 RepID=A0A2C6KFC7_9APIC|nr:hypothetical protein CSUI_011153 [Cystoisospora suis]